MQVQVRRRFRVEVAQEVEPFLLAVARGALVEDFALQIVERGKERGGPVMGVVLRAGADVAGAQRQAGLGAFERLALAFLPRFCWGENGRAVSLRAASGNPASPSVAKRPRHLATVLASIRWPVAPTRLKSLTIVLHPEVQFWVIAHPPTFIWPDIRAPYSL